MQTSEYNVNGTVKKLYVWANIKYHAQSYASDVVFVLANSEAQARELAKDKLWEVCGDLPSEDPEYWCYPMNKIMELLDAKPDKIIDDSIALFWGYSE